MPSERAGADGRARGLVATWPVGFVRTDRDREAMLVLASIPGLTARRLRVLAGREGGAADCLAAVREGRAGDPGDEVPPGVGSSSPSPGSQAGPDAAWWTGPAAERRPPAVDMELARTLSPGEIRDRLHSIGARMAFPGDPDYPERILDLSDPPPAMFVRGAGLSELSGGVAVVGARSCSALGEEIAVRFGRELASAGVPVISGGARGIDTAAHRGALDAGGPTVAVLGCGIDVAYPTRNRSLLARIAAAGAVVSEYPPGVPAQAFRFPARNRIVAALADALLVVEGAAGSGSMITADHALDLGRPVFAVPGPVTSPLSEVPLALIRDGAGLVRNTGDLLEDLGRLDPGALDGASGVPTGDPELVGAEGAGAAPGLSQLERRLLERLSGPTLPEVLAAALGTEVGEVLGAVVGLEVRGLVRTVGGRVERRLGGGPP
ncbi:MAG TPA: DNA-processing protein DprA [Actinomycetota bacterium]